MLQIKDICKQYKTGTLVQQALDHVSLNLRDNEFVAILGPSGSGKTTLLNILGGLDRYDSGDLIINGISTKKYKDKDWDSYRNHTIGFVFQSYNLIPHQTVLANVELALTISGISGAERKKRAEEALRKVGLGNQMHKKPNQMSGGQMQRVAIARALVNNPDVLLADEPTGALDSETSVQVMDLLKEVAKDRLVVMVTHNPDLAYKYANRIITLKDGKITSDSNPLTVEEEQAEPVHKNMGKSSMSFLTALSLSFNNLLTKKARTILVAFAGSIGIIGIALIMSLSNGVNQYIKHTEQESLAEYPLEIDSTSFNLSSLLQEPDTKNSDDDGKVKEKQVVSNMFSKVTSNDLASLKKYIDSNQSKIKDYSRSIEYRYNISPRIYRMNGDEVIQVNPNDLLASSGIAPTSSAYSSSFSMDVFSQLPRDASLYKDVYQVKAGRWPEKYNELVVILDQNGEISDMVSYTLGLKDYDALKTLVENSENGTSGKQNESSEQAEYSYDDLLGKTFSLVNASDIYTYDDSLGVWSDRSSDSDYMKNLVENGEELKIVGVVQPDANSNITMLSEGIGYTSDLVQHMMTSASDSPAVQAQLKDKNTNIFTGQPFGSESSDLDLSSLFSIDENKMQSAFNIDTSRLNSSMDMNSLADSIQLPNVSEADMKQVLSKIDLSSLNNIDAQKIFSDVMQEWLSENPDYQTVVSGIGSYLKDEGGQIIVNDLDSFLGNNGNKEEISNALNTLYSNLADEYVKSLNGQIENTDIAAGFQQYLESDEVKEQIQNELQKIISSIQLSDAQKEQLKNDVLNGYTAYAEKNNYSTPEKLMNSFQTFMQSDKASSIIEKDVTSMVDVNQIESSIASALASSANTYMQSIQSSLTSALTNMMSSFVYQLPNAFSFNADAFKDAVQMNMNADQLQEMFSSMLSSQTSSYENNLKELGYAEEDSPYSILIYPNDFDAKSSIKNILSDYNQQMENNGEDDKVIVYTDMVETLMSSVTRIVNTVSWALIAFVGISLIVSSIMIGVITYISVLERRKEIGILRAIGASKHNVSEVFNAETFITGLLAGLIGVGIASLLLIPGNHLIAIMAERSDIHASLPIQNALGLIALSVVLTLISGLIPAKKAANSDPVKALRSE